MGEIVSNMTLAPSAPGLATSAHATPTTAAPAPADPSVAPTTVPVIADYASEGYTGTVTLTPLG